METAGSSAFEQKLQANKPRGPFFIDTGGCECALQDKDSEEAWRCLANTPENIYEGDDGKWFYAVDQANSDSLTEPENSDSNPPDTAKAYEIKNGEWWTFPSDADDGVTGNIQDQFCTGLNQTSASETFYNQSAALLSGQDFPCWQPGAVPLVLETAATWNTSGCKLGFFCPNNTDTHLPTYCPPIPDVQMARLAGQRTAPMGPYEPAICEHSYYCPRGGKEQIICPAGHYCPEGTFAPLQCSFGAKCPEGSYYNRSTLPIVLLGCLDFLLISLVVSKKLLWSKQNKRSRKRNTGVQRMKKAFTFSTANFGSPKFHPLPDDDVHLEARISEIKRSPTGFMTDVDNYYAFEGDEDHASYTDEKSDPDIQQFVQSLSKCNIASNFGLSFDFENLKFQPDKKRKPILSEVSGQINSGTLWGVMGASGAGKSTFVNVLMGKWRISVAFVVYCFLPTHQDPLKPLLPPKFFNDIGSIPTNARDLTGKQSHTGGVTKVNGSPGAISKYKKIIGYVPQDDIVLPELTVRENILHSARIRLPSNWKGNEIQKHVDILLRCLHLYHIKDSLVGSPSKPVISGGERKRVSIGIELAAAPMALFLDEPTSGLDATSASSIMSTLKALSRLGITVVAIIHQPRHEIFSSLDFIHLMGAGRVIYSGKEEEVQPYFEQCGFIFPRSANPADTIMDIIAGEGHLYKKSGDTSISNLIDYWKLRQDNLKKTDSRGAPSSVETAALRKTVKIRGAPWYSQIYFCLIRALLQQYRRKSSFFFELGVAALAGLLIGLAFVTEDGMNFRGIFNSPYELLSSSTDFTSIPEMSLLVGLAIGLTASSPGVKIFGEEKLIYVRESSAGHNRFAYYIGKVLSTIPRMILANLHFTVLFMLLSTPKISWAGAFIANLLYFYCIYGLASCISMITRREDGPLIATMFSLIVGVISGVSPTLTTVRGWHMTWLWRSSPGTWLSEGYFTMNVVPYDYLYQIQQATEQTGYLFGEFRQDLLMLFAIGTIYRVIAFVALRIFNRKNGRG